MATASPLPGSPPEHRGFTHWMQRVLKELDVLRSAPDKDAVHDLRVAIRRCRSVAAVMREVDPDPAWHEMRRLPKKLFRKLGELRDTQIMDEWVAEHGAENDKLRVALHNFFQEREPKLLRQALRLAGKFDEKNWQRLERKLRKRIRLVPAGSLAAQCLAVERLNEAKELHGKALRVDKPATWHGLRIGLKKFRYTVESLLPQQYEAWSTNLKQLQDILGEVHDLDVLRGIIKQKATGDAAELQPEWERTIERQRSARLQEYRDLAIGKNSVWHDWQQALPHGKRLQIAAIARLRVTARATDAHPHRAAHISRLSVALFDALGRAHSAPVFDDADMRRVLRGAARFCGLSLKGTSRPPQKAARRFLLERPVPPSWAHKEWELLAWTVRYHRGAEPKTQPNKLNSAFARLHEDQQATVRALAGVVRLARGLRKCRIEHCNGFRVEKTAAALLLHVSGLVDSAENAARLAAAKHLLDTYLGKPLILKPTPPSQIVELPSPADNQLPFAAASD
ncbi:MAG TPA: CHAD domain-containing protein [Candidatus Acidoferrum sp.]|nr:CHAD domain-containing protein [Candidatus Acidoferrum sp.]